MNFAGLRILVVEDEFLVALGLEGELRALGCDVVGPVANLSVALDVARNEGLDAALLDVSLGRDCVFPAAAILAARGVPFVFCSAFTSPEPVPRRFADRPRVAKPFTGAMIIAALASVVMAGGAGRPDVADCKTGCDGRARRAAPPVRAAREPGMS
ncbi:response regulator [Xanthobacter variabilis]|uniref:response regulator n=1 Tax=Xanthobacter variabilis TaxID=3119932 RepID=UPI003729FB0B